MKRPNECVNVLCGAMCSMATYEFNKGIFGKDPTKCPDYEYSPTAENLIAYVNGLNSRDRARFIECLTCEHNPGECGKGDEDENENGFCKYHSGNCIEGSAFAYMIMERRKNG